MERYYYDLHIHSCLSPCGDNDMTPNNIAGMGVINGLNLMALTDHNTTENCPAFFAAAKKNGIIPIAGMELTTAEDIHVVCLLPDLDAAAEFDEAVGKKRVLIPNRTDIFGEQLIMNGEDEVTGCETNLLSNATLITIDETPALVKSFGGVCYPAHIDREANGIIATLGTFPPECGFTAAELHDKSLDGEYREKYPALQNVLTVISSDAHYLWHIKDKSEYLELPGDNVTAELFTLLSGGKP